jgi:ribosomal protein S15P/S13E
MTDTLVSCITDIVAKEDFTKHLDKVHNATDEKEAKHKKIMLVKYAVLQLEEDKALHVVRDIVSSDDDKTMETGATTASRATTALRATTRATAHSDNFEQLSLLELMDTVYYRFTKKRPKNESFKEVNKMNLNTLKKRVVVLQEELQKVGELWEAGKQAYDTSEEKGLVDEVARQKEELKRVQEVASLRQSTVNNMQEQATKAKARISDLEDEVNKVKEEAEKFKADSQKLDSVSTELMATIEKYNNLKDAFEKYKKDHAEDDLSAIFRKGSKKRQRLESAYKDTVLTNAVTAIRTAEVSIQNKILVATQQANHNMFLIRNQIKAVKELLDKQKLTAADKTKLSDHVENITTVTENYEPSLPNQGPPEELLKDIKEVIERAEHGYITMVISGEEID